MKKLSKLKLNQLSKNEIEKREMNMISGGSICCTPCPCAYYGPQEGPDDGMYGGSSPKDNRAANNEMASKW